MQVLANVRRAGFRVLANVQRGWFRVLANDGYRKNCDRIIPTCGRAELTFQ